MARTPDLHGSRPRRPHSAGSASAPRTAARAREAGRRSLREDARWEEEYGAGVKERLAGQTFESRTPLTGTLADGLTSPEDTSRTEDRTEPVRPCIPTLTAQVLQIDTRRMQNIRGRPLH